MRKTPPKLALGVVRVADDKTLEALIANRYEVMAQYAKTLKGTVGGELARLKAQGAKGTANWKKLRLAKRWLHRDDDKIPPVVKPQIAQVVAQNAPLALLVAMREELRGLWTRSNASAPQLVADLQAWCKRAEDSGIAALQEFSLRLRAAHA